MAGKSSISLVSIQKPTANTPVLQRRNKLMTSLNRQIALIENYKAGRKISKEAFWLDGSAIFFSITYGKQPVGLGDKHLNVLKAASFEDLIMQIEELKTITLAGGLDEPLSVAASKVRSNFKKKAVKGA